MQSPVQSSVQPSVQPSVQSLAGVHFLLGESTLGTGALPTAVAQALAGGVRVFQLRDKQASFESRHAQMHTLMELLDSAARRQKEPLTLMINDTPELARVLKQNLAERNSPLNFGLHLGREDLVRLCQDEAKSLTRLRQEYGAEAVFGLSVESPAQLSEATTRTALAEVNYLGAGPVFATPSKPDAAPAFGLAGLGKICRSGATLPVIAIGGVEPSNVQACHAAGARGGSGDFGSGRWQNPHCRRPSLSPAL